MNDGADTPRTASRRRMPEKVSSMHIWNVGWSSMIGGIAVAFGRVFLAKLDDVTEWSESLGCTTGRVSCTLILGPGVPFVRGSLEDTVVAMRLLLRP